MFCKHPFHQPMCLKITISDIQYIMTMMTIYLYIQRESERVGSERTKTDMVWVPYCCTKGQPHCWGRSHFPFLHGVKCGQMGNNNMMMVWLSMEFGDGGCLSSTGGGRNVIYLKAVQTA